MKVSVIIPTYNEETYITACLQSLMDQQEKADEIIVVNNNSTDKTVAIAKKFPVRIVNEKKQGMIYSRNRGFNEAKYEIILRTDADTRVPKNWVKRIKQTFKKDENLIALSGPASYYDVPAPFNTTPLITQIYIEMIEEKALKHDSLFGPNMAIKKSAWQKVKDEVCLEDKAVHEDIDLAIHLGSIGKIKFDPKLIVAASGRRWKKLSPYFEQPYRSLKTIRRHNKFVLEIYGKRIIRKVVPRALLRQLHLPAHH